MTTVPKPSRRPALSAEQERASTRLVAVRRGMAAARRRELKANEERRRAVRAAIAAGLAPGYIAKALDISRQRVEQIAAER